MWPYFTPFRQKCKDAFQSGGEPPGRRHYRASPRSRFDCASAFNIAFNCSGRSRWPSASKCSKFSCGLASGPLLALLLAQTLRHGPHEGCKIALTPLLTDAPIITVALVVAAKNTRINTRCARFNLPVS